MEIRNHKWPMALLSAGALLAIASATLAMPQDSFLQQVVDALRGRPHPALAPRATAATMASVASHPSRDAGPLHDERNDDPMTTRDEAGWLRTFRHEGTIDRDNAFFQSLGSNGRSCETCHNQAAGWSVTPEQIRARFAASNGNDPIFRTVDGSNSPIANVSTTAARRSAYSMLLNRGVIRVGIAIPANAEYTLADVDDPYHFASAGQLSLFRRPLPSTNLAFLTGVMWDGRENTRAFSAPMHAGEDNAALQSALIHQAMDATLGHAQATSPPTDAQLAEIVAFETSLSTAQVRDEIAGFLNGDDALGGPRALSNQRFHVGINDTLGGDPTGALFDDGAISLFDAWDEQAWHNDHSRRGNARAAILRGERVFNTRALTISGVGGFNDALGQPSVEGTCSSCHNTPNVGNHSVGLPLDIGLTDASRRTPDMPLYTLRNNATGALRQTTDPGLALVTGKWKDIARFKGPILRGVVARAPYFHNGFAATLPAVVDFYDIRFAMHLTRLEKNDLVAFLRSL